MHIHPNNATNKVGRRSCYFLAMTMLLVLSLRANNLWAQSAILAKVNGQPISEDQVARELQRTLGKLKLGPLQTVRAKSETLEKRINQLVIIDFLRVHNLAAGENEIRLEVDSLKTKLATVEKTIADHLAQTNQTQEDLEFNLSWQLAWKRYLDQMLTDELLESHFQNKKRQFDGSELRVAHLLLKPDSDNDANPEKTSEVSRRNAERIKSQIDAGELSWDQAVIQNSDAPTKESGGEIGWIKWTGPMPDTFTKAAFELDPNEISEPIQTKFGVHIIRCIEFKPGKLGWRDQLESVKKSATLELFNAVVAQHRPKMTVEYSSPPHRPAK